MVNISIDVTDLGGEAHPGDKVIFWRPRVGGSATHAGRVISTAPHTVLLEDGTATVPDVEPGEMRVLLQCRGFESQEPMPVTVPDGTGVVTLRALVESQFEYSPPIVSAVQRAADNAADSERAAIRAQVRSEAAADRADAKVDDAINNGANLVRNEVKQDADRAVSARQVATQSESNAKASEDAAASSASNAAASESAAKQSESNAGDYATVATTAATEAVDAMERATEIAGGDFATRDYVNQKVSSVTLVGEGFPEGKVSAPVGAVYTDSAATNGAIRWIKTRGTGATGWAVEYGDTGSRMLHSPDSPPPTGTGTIRLRRTGDLVTLSILILVLPDDYVSSATIFTVPRGFIPEHAIFSHPIVDRNFMTNHQTIDITAAGAVSIVGKPARRMYLQMSWNTPDAWPTSLPGTPA